MRHVDLAHGPAEQRLDAVAGQIELHRHRLVLDQRPDAAEQIKAFLQRRADFRPIRPARHNGDLGSGTVGLERGLPGRGGLDGQQLGAGVQRRQRRPDSQRKSVPDKSATIEGFRFHKCD